MKRKKNQQIEDNLLSTDQKINKTSLKKSDALESIIDPDTYMIGPGDHLLVSIWGQVNESFPVFVSPEGYLLIPTVKEIDVHGLTLSNAKKKIVQEMKQVYTSADITVGLVTVRSFRVNVTGLTQTTGSVVVSAVDRVSDAITMAGGLLDSNTASLRNIRIFRKDKSVVFADLIKRSNAGDLRYDPVLMDGDVIYVPPVYAHVYIYGGVQIPGKYEHVANEPLSELIKVAGGLVFGADSSQIEITRFRDDTSKVYQFLKINFKDLIKNSSDTSKDIILQANDRVLVKNIPQFQEKNNITIRGEVQYPGVYPIVDNITKFSDIVRMSGGFTNDVSFDNITIYRDIRYEGRDTEYERLLQTPVVDMNDDEKAYFKAKSRQYYPTVQTDFNKLYAGNSINSQFDVYLKDGDLIDIGRKKKTIRVVGGIISPGIVDIVPGKNVQYYIDKCGGYSSRAKKSDGRIIRAASQSWLDISNKIEIEDGDVVFIPEKEPVDGWKIFRETVAMVGQLAAITATIILISIQVKN